MSDHNGAREGLERLPQAQALMVCLRIFVPVELR